MKNYLMLSTLALAFDKKPAPQPSRKFAKLAINPRNGGLHLLGMDSKWYSCSYNLSILDSHPNFPNFIDMATWQGVAVGIRTDNSIWRLHPNMTWEMLTTHKAKKVAGDYETGVVWLIGMDDLVYKLVNGTPMPITPNKTARALDVLNNEIFLVGRDDNKLYRIKNNSLTEIPGVLASDVAVDEGLPLLWYISATDKQVYSLDMNQNMNAANAMKYPAVMNAKAIAAHGRCPYIISETGILYAGINKKWTKALLAPN